MADFCNQVSKDMFGLEHMEGDFKCSDEKCPARTNPDLAHWHLCEGCGYAPHDCAGRCLGTEDGCDHPSYGCKAAEQATEAKP